MAANFTATGELPTPTELPAWGDAGPLNVNSIKNGPLKVSGSHEVTSGSGHATKRGDTAFLCRCGASANKPFCDGTHRKTGFTAPGG